MSLQELTAALRQKEDDKSDVIKTLQVMGQLANDKGAKGRILFQVTECFIEDMKFDIVVLPTDSVVSTESMDLNNKSLKEETEIYVTSKEVAIEIHFLVAGLEYTALLDVPEVPDNSSISMSLESVCAANGAKSDIRIKATFDYLAEIIHSKSIELEQVMNDVKTIKQQVQTAARGVVKKPQPKKAPAKKAPQAAPDSDEEEVEEVEDFDDEEDEEGPGPSQSAMQSAQAAVAVALDVAMRHKAVGMFLVTSLAIFFQGDQMSV